MMKKTLSILTLLAAGTGHAAGFSFDTHSARATSMGFAAVANMQDSSAIAYNAANILGVEKLDITAGDLITLPRINFTAEGTDRTQAFDTLLAPPPHAFGVYRLNEKMAVGLGLFVPFAAGSKWPDDFDFRTRGYKAQLATYHLNPTFAYQAHPRLRVGVGVSVIRGTVDIERKLNFVSSEGTVELGGGAWGLAYNAGIQLTILDKLLQFGGQFRSPSSLTFKGDVDFRDIPPAFQTQLRDQSVQSTVQFPGSASAGLLFTPSERLSIAFDLKLMLWSTFEEFTIEFDDPSLTNPLPKFWENTWNFHLGAEFKVTENFLVRLGTAFDRAPSPENTLSPDLPDADRYRLAAGVGYALNPVRVDLGYQYIFLGNTKSTIPGISGAYDGDGHIFGLTLGYSLK
ncbi:OmpP1/FadL family transporter [Stigmatella aurantiaca]|nr:outer membrane protein transport protein [Stigmatella aurantiaca]